MANITGRRPVVLIAALIAALSSVWCARAQSYGSLLAARVFQAIGSGASETVSPAMIGDVFFVHERGRAMVGSSYQGYRGRRLI